MTRYDLKLFDEARLPTIIHRELDAIHRDSSKLDRPAAAEWRSPLQH
jgi:hypothetical protein